MVTEIQNRAAVAPETPTPENDATGLSGRSVVQGNGKSDVALRRDERPDANDTQLSDRSVSQAQIEAEEVGEPAHIQAPMASSSGSEEVTDSQSTWVQKTWNSLDISSILPKPANDAAAYVVAKQIVADVEVQLNASLNSAEGQALPVDSQNEIAKLIASMKTLVADKSAFSRASLAVASLVPFAPPLYTAVRQIPSSGALYATTQVAFYLKTMIQLAVLANDQLAGGKEFGDSFKYRQLVSLAFSTAFIAFAIKSDPTDRQPPPAVSLPVAAGVFALSLAVFNTEATSNMLSKAYNQVTNLLGMAAQEPAENVQHKQQFFDSHHDALEQSLDQAIATLKNAQGDENSPLGNVANDKVSSVISVLYDLKSSIEKLSSVDLPVSITMDGSSAQNNNEDRAAKLGLTGVAVVASTVVALSNAIPGNYSGFADFLLDGILGVSELAKGALDPSVNLQGHKALFTDLQGLTLLLVPPYLLDLIADQPGSKTEEAFYSLLVIMSVANLTIPGPLGTAMGDVVEKMGAVISNLRSSGPTDVESGQTGFDGGSARINDPVVIQDITEDRGPALR